ncbi:hypothetical protein HMPREF0063_11418 [Aeromicrobium marinum DSM 15272]|uniref:Transglycosylase SLT domain-containing protein n=1 Tax=Aeromicrobium marinum DSM 15272 TaxID=585531 RepID=E2SBK9_9ACTN|nr:lytic murein transglycosylase [Aeromicrobium marinum]EFQ83755.1 hypothetical protein HMPREF0063_11418 [Aeromicrobium marinum DSM 15272]
MRRLLVVPVAVLAVVAGCGTVTGGGPTERPRPDVDLPERAVAAPVLAGVVEAGWLGRTSGSTGIPPRVLQAYAAAESRLAEEDPACGIGWNVLAGIGQIESIHGAVNGSRIGADGVASPPIIGIALDGDGVAAIPDTDGGRLDGDTEWDRAVGPMQFIPTTWAEWGADGDGDGRRDPQDVDDAALAAARYLCDAGVVQEKIGFTDAVLTYNRSARYARDVSSTATAYARDTA